MGAAFHLRRLLRARGAAQAGGLRAVGPGAPDAGSKSDHGKAKIHGAG